jgi:hypothetical protein
MTLPKKRKLARPTNEKLANSNEWAELDAAIMRGWLDEFRKLSDHNRKHTPALDRVYLILFYLCSRQRWKPKYDLRVIDETLDQISIGGDEGIGGVISFGSAQDIVQFLEWLGVLVTVREGGKGNATKRQLLKPDYALRSVNPVVKDQRETDKRNGISAFDNGIRGTKQRDKPRNSKRPQRHTSTTPALSEAALVDETNSLDTHDYDASNAAGNQVMAELRAKGTLRPKKTSNGFSDTA